MKDESITNVEETKVEKDLFVNEATLELLSKRIEADVKKGFFKSIGAPIGGAGIAAILYVLFSWIPAQLGNMIEKVPSIQHTIKVSVTDYLGNEEKGEKFIRDQVNLNSEKFVSKAVKDYMASDKMSGDLQSIIEKQTSSYYNSEGSSKLIGQIVRNSMESEAVRQQIREAVDNALSPVLGSLSHEIEERFSSLVFELPELAGTEQISKQSLEVLMRFLRNPKASAIKESGNPVVLTIAIGHGPYVSYVIDAYIQKLQQEFAEQFRYIVILDKEERFIALINSRHFLSAIKEDSSLLELLNDNNRSATEVSIQTRFGKAAIRRIRTNDVVRDVLLTRSLWESPTHSKFIGVIGKSGKLMGITSRRKIIDGCLSEING